MSEEIQKIEKLNNPNCKIVSAELNNFVFANQVNQLSPDVIDEIKTKSRNILCHCVAPSYPRKGSQSDTGLVIGYVQSGKTLSFTSVISMAADNAYRIVVILAGRDNLLLDQTYERLKLDLGYRKNRKNYAFFQNPRTEDLKNITTQLNNSRKPTLVITILKHQLYLNSLANIFTNKTNAEIISRLGVLIIDDEADQASLNTSASRNATKETWQIDEYSAIYEGIINLKNSIPYHSYIQYTATPQGNLLYDFLDELSPKWHEVLNPGPAYTGGKYFFREEVGPITLKYPYKVEIAKLNNSTVVYDKKGSKKQEIIGSLNLIRQIPQIEAYHPSENPLVVAPESLKECLRSFLINCTIITELEKFDMDHSSMIIHLHSFTSSSKQAQIWIRYLLDQWSIDYTNKTTNLKKEFKKTFDQDAISNPHNHKFNDVYKSLEHVISNYKIHLVIAGIEKIEWEDAQAHILIGGMKLDRGFTVENLTHTYMPRYSLSTSQADTIQQRCRFFGYKKKYGKYCRVYIPKDSILEYSDYVLDEEDLRNFLIIHKDIKDFFDPNQALSLSPRLQPTRLNILSKSLVKNNFKGTKFFNPLNENVYALNNNLKDTFLTNIKKKKLGTIDYYSPMRTHDVYRIELNDFRNDFLTKFSVDTGIECLFKKKLDRYLDYLISEGKNTCFIINMSQGKARKREIKRRIIKSKGQPDQYIHAIDNPFSGKEPNTINPRWPNEKDLIVKENCKYHKDFSYNDEVVIQFHKILIKKFEGDTSKTGKEFTTVSFYFPERFAKRYIALKS